MTNTTPMVHQSIHLPVFLNDNNVFHAENIVWRKNKTTIINNNIYYS